MPKNSRGTVATLECASVLDLFTSLSVTLVFASINEVRGADYIYARYMRNFNQDCNLALKFYFKAHAHKFQPVDYMGNFSPKNRAEVSARKTGLKFSSCNRKLRFTRIL